MEHATEVTQGMQVFGSDHQLVGKVTEVTSDRFTAVIHIEGGYTVPTSAVDHVEGDRVILPNPASMYLSQLRAHDHEYQQELEHFQRHFSERQGEDDGDRTFADAEPNYRFGYAAGADTRYAGRDFEEVEAELRRAHEADASGAAAGWEHLRDEVWAGWQRARERTIH
jgi:hypothetical protein